MSETPVVVQENKKKIEQQFCVHVGTYEGTILGFVGNLQQLESRYAYTISPGSIKAIVTSSRFLFVSGYDEIIRIYDTKKFKEIGNLDGHTGSVLTMESHKNILLSSGDDGNILTWKFKEWGLIHRLKAHTTTIYDICIHPSGKILISISKDNRLFVWNLMNGQKVYQKRFPYNLNKVIMLEEDKYICVLSDYNVHIIDATNNKEVGVLKSTRRINDFITYKNFLIVGDEKGFVSIWDPNFQLIKEEERQVVEEEQQAQNENENGEENNEQEAPCQDHSKKISFKAHSNRVKKMRIENIDGMDLLISVSSSGEIKIWDFLEGIFNNGEFEHITEDKELENELKPVYQIFTNQRITAMAVTVYHEQEKQEPKQKKQEKEEVLDEEEQYIQEQAKILEQQEKEKKEPQKEGQPKSILKKTKKIQKPQQQQKQNKAAAQPEKPLNRKDKKKLKQQKMQQRKEQKKQQQQNKQKN